MKSTAGTCPQLELVKLKQQTLDKFLVSGFKLNEPIYNSSAYFIPKHPRHLTIPNILANINKSGHFDYRNHDNNNVSIIQSCCTKLSTSEIKFQDIACNSVRVGISVIRFENAERSPSLFAVGGSNGLIRVFDIHDCYHKLQKRNVNLPIQAQVIINTRKDISDLRWSSLDMDELAVCFSFQPMIHIYNLNQPSHAKHVLELGQDFHKGSGHTVVKYLPTKWWTSATATASTSASATGTWTGIHGMGHSHTGHHSHSHHAKVSSHNNANINGINNTNSTSNTNNSTSTSINNKHKSSSPAVKREYLVAGGSDGSIHMWCYPDRTKKLTWEISSTSSSATNVPIVDIEVLTHKRGHIVSMNQCGVLCIFDIFNLEKKFAIESPKCLKRLLVFESLHKSHSYNNTLQPTSNANTSHTTSNTTAGVASSSHYTSSISSFKHPLVLSMKFMTNDGNHLYIFTQNNQTFRYSLSEVFSSLTSIQSQSQSQSQSQLIENIRYHGTNITNTIINNNNNNNNNNNSNNYNNKHNISNNKGDNFINNKFSNHSNNSTSSSSSSSKWLGRGSELEISQADALSLSLSHCSKGSSRAAGQNPKKRTIIQADETVEKSDELENPLNCSPFCRPVTPNWLCGFYGLFAVKGTVSFQIINLASFEPVNSRNDHLVASNSVSTSAATGSADSSVGGLLGRHSTHKPPVTVDSSHSTDTSTAPCLSNLSAGSLSEYDYPPCVYTSSGASDTLTLPGWVLAAEPGSHDVLVTTSLEAYLKAESSSVSTKSSRIYFDWSAVAASLDVCNLYGVRANNNTCSSSSSSSTSSNDYDGDCTTRSSHGSDRGASLLPVPYMDSEGVAHTHGAANKVEKVYAHHVILQKPYVGPHVSMGTPRVYMRTNLQSINSCNDNNSSKSSSSNSNNNTTQQSMKENKRRIFKEHSLNSAVTAIECHPTLPYVILGYFSNDIQLMNVDNDSRRSGSSSSSERGKDGEWYNDNTVIDLYMGMNS